VTIFHSDDLLRYLYLQHMVWTFENLGRNFSAASISADRYYRLSKPETLSFIYAKRNRVSVERESLLIQIRDCVILEVGNSIFQPTPVLLTPQKNGHQEINPKIATLLDLTQALLIHKQLESFLLE
jgi:hypothetical protein